MSYEGKIKIVIEGAEAAKGADKVSTSLDKVHSKSKKVTTANSQLTSSYGMLKTAMIGITGLSFGAVLVGMINTTKEFDSAISELSAITGAVGPDLDYLSDSARELGQVTTLSASQVSIAFKLVASAKPDLLESAEALKAVTKETITLAEAAGIELPEAANTLASSLNQFGVEADQASRFVNVLAAGSKFGAASIADMGASMKAAGTTAAGANISFEETNAAIQSLSTVAIKGEQAGTALRNIILKLQKEGIEQLDPSIVGLTQALKNLNEENRSTTELIKLFGLENVNAAQALLNQADNLDALTDKLTGTNIAYEQARIQVDNLAGDQLKLNSAWEEGQIAIGSLFTPALRIILQGVAKDITAITASYKEMNVVIQQQKIADLEGDWIRLTNTLEKQSEVLDKVTWSKAGLHVSTEALEAYAAEAAQTERELENVNKQLEALYGNTSKNKEVQKEVTKSTEKQVENLKSIVAETTKLSDVQKEINALLADFNDLDIQDTLFELNSQLQDGVINGEQFQFAMEKLGQHAEAASGNVKDLAVETEKLTTVADPVAIAWENMFNRLDESGADYWGDFVRGAKTSTDIVKEIGYDFLAEMLHAFTTQQLTANFSANFSATGATSGTSPAAMFGQEGGGSTDLISMGQQLWDGFSSAGSSYSGFLAGEGMLGSLGSSIGSIGAASSFVGAGAGASQAAMLASQTSAFGIAGTASTTAALGGTMTGTASAMGAISTAIPYIGWAIAIASMLGAFDGNSDVTPDLNTRVRSPEETPTGAYITSLGEEENGTFDPNFGYGGLFSRIGFGTQHDAFSSEGEAQNFIDSLTQTYAGLENAIVLALGEPLAQEIADSMAEFDTGSMKAEEAEDFDALIKNTFSTIFDKVFDGIGGTMSTLYDELIASGVGLEETVLRVSSVFSVFRDYVETDLTTTFDDFLVEQELANRTLYEVYADNIDVMGRAASEFDQSIEAYEEIAFLVSSSRAMELQLLGQIHAISQAIDIQAANATESMLLQTLNEQETFDYKRDKYGSQYEELLSTDDPLRIGELSDSLLRGIPELFSSIAEEDKKDMLPEFQAALDIVAEKSQEGLADTETQVKEMSEQIAAAITDAMTLPAEVSRQAASDNVVASKIALQAAKTPVTVKVMLEPAYAGEAG